MISVPRTWRCVFAFALLALASTKPRRVGAETVCILHLAGTNNGDLPDHLSDDLKCSCHENSEFGAANVLLYPFANPSLAAICDPSGFDGGFSGPSDNWSPVSVGIWWGDIGNERPPIGIWFQGNGNLVLDGGSNWPPAPVAADLDLSSNGPDTPLLRFSGLQNLTLRNLRFRNLTATAPLILLENCSNVTLQNVTFEDVRLVAGPSAAVAGALVAVGTGSREVALQGVTARRIAVPVDTKASSPLGLVSIGQCMGGCSVSGLRIEDLALLADGWAGLRVEASPGLRIQDVTVAGATCSGAAAALVQIAGGGGGVVEIAGVELERLVLAGGCSALEVLGGTADGLAVTGVSLKDSSFSGAGAAVLFSALAFSTNSTHQGQDQEAQQGPASGEAIKRALLRDLLLTNVTLLDGGSAVVLDRCAGVDVEDVSLMDVGPPIATAGTADASSTSPTPNPLVRVIACSDVGLVGVDVGQPTAHTGQQQQQQVQHAAATWVSVEGGSQVLVQGVRNAGVAASDNGGAAGVGGLEGHGLAAVAVSACQPGCGVRRLSLRGCSLRGGAQVLTVSDSSGMQISDLQLSGIAVSGTATDWLANPGVVTIVNSNDARLQNIWLSDLTVSAADGHVHGVSLSGSSNVTATDVDVLRFDAGTSLASAWAVSSSSVLNLQHVNCSGSRSGSGPCLSVAGSSSVTVVGSSFVGNSAGSNGRGGAVYVDDMAGMAGAADAAGGGNAGGGGSRLEVWDSQFVGNTAGIGGALALVGVLPAAGGGFGGAAPSLFLTRCTFSDNQALPRDNSQAARGGDVYLVDGSSLEASTCSFLRSSAAGPGGNGGSIFSHKARVSIAASNFTDCSVRGRGGAVYHEPVARFCPTFDACALLLEDCRFSHNAAEQGGAVLALLNNNTAARLQVRGCTFTANNASASGGGLAVPGDCMPFEDRSCALADVQLDPQGQHGQGQGGRAVATQVTNCSFNGNNALQGGALFAAFNKAQGVNISGCNFTANNASETAGAYIRVVPWVEVRHSRFTNNTAAVVSALSLMSLHFSALVHDTRFRKNTCRNSGENSGSALLAGEYDGVTRDGSYGGPLFTFTLTNSTFQENLSSSDGGAVTLTRCNAVLEDVIFLRNIAVRRAGALYLLQDVGKVMVAAMEGVPQQETNGTLRRVRFECNCAASLGGAALVSGWHVQMEAVDFANNSVSTLPAGNNDNSGGALAGVRCPSPLRMRQVTMTSNIAFQGGGVFALLCDMELRGATFTNNRATGDAGAVLFQGFNPGGDTNASKYTLEFYNATFQGNIAANMGGAVKVYWANIAATDSHFVRNQASVDGGALHLQVAPAMPGALVVNPVDSGERATLSRCELRDNTAGNTGGALYLSASALHLADCQLTGNTAGSDFFTDNWSNSGGALFATSCTAPLVLVGGRLETNNATGRGGAVALLACAGRLESLELRDNVAELSGGAVAAGHRVTKAQPQGLPLSLTNCNLTNNTALAEGGGAIHASLVPLTLRGCRLDGNTARQLGGAVLSAGAPALALRGSSLAGNTAGLSGGALWAESSGLVQLVGTSVSNNAATESGGGLALLNPQCAHLQGVTLTANSASEGGGAFVAMPAFVTGKAGAAISVSDGLSCLSSMNDGLAALRSEGGGVSGDGVAGAYVAADTSDAASALSDEGRRVLYWQDKGVSLLASGVTATRNTATNGQGGGLLLKAVRGPLLVDGLIAETNAALGGDGGAVAVTETRSPEGTVLYVTSARFYDNTASGSGGALALDGFRTHQQAILVNVTLLRNRASSGGALALRNNASVALHGSTLDGNVASVNSGKAPASSSGAGSSTSSVGSGGSVFAASCFWIVLNGSTIRDSAAIGGHGGGLYASGCASTAMYLSAFHANNASGWGGGAYLVGDSAAAAGASSLALLSAVNMSGNTAGAAPQGSTAPADAWGGALYAGGALTLLSDRSLFSSNMATGMGGALAVDVGCQQKPTDGSDINSATSYDTATAAGSSNTQGSTQSSLYEDAAQRLSRGLDGIEQQFGATLQALRRVGARSVAMSCWSALLNRPHLWNNSAGTSGGAVYASSPFTMSLLCDEGGGGGVSASAPAASPDAQLASIVGSLAENVAAAPLIVVPAAAAESAERNNSAAAAGGSGGDSALTGEQAGGERLQGRGVSCFLQLNEDASRQLSDTPGASAVATGANHAHSGYGANAATAPKELILASLEEHDRVSLLTYTNETAADGGGGAGGANATALRRRQLRLVASYGIGRLLSQEQQQPHLPSPSPSAAAAAPDRPDGWSAAVSGVPLWLRRAVLFADGRPAASCWPGQECRLVLPTNAAVTFNVSLYDAFNQLANDTGVLRPVVRASVATMAENGTAGSGDGNSDEQIDILGNPTALVSRGVAALTGLRLRARKGNYTLKLDLAATAADTEALPPLKLNLTVPPCSMGEVSLDDGYLCTRCAINTYSLDLDRGTAAAASSSSGSGSGSGRSGVTHTDGRCMSCPDHATCPGGAVVVPMEGYWHSAANSTSMHQCLNACACRKAGDSANAALLRCQERWYTYFGSTGRLAALMDSSDGGEALVAAYLDVYSAVLAASGGRMQPDNASSVAAAITAAAAANPLLPAGAVSDGFLLDCALWGLPRNHSASYMQLQCTPGYTGTLCATCTMYDGQPYALSSDFECSPCFSVWLSALIGIALFMANTLWLGFSVLLTFLTDYRYQDDEDVQKVPAADLLKVLIVHFQFYIIVTQINLDWPMSVLGLNVVLGSITGSVKQVYSPSCLWPGADSATQAAVQTLCGLLLPILSVLLVMGLWSLRYYYWNQAAHGQPAGSMRVHDVKQPTTRNGSLARDDPPSRIGSLVRNLPASRNGSLMRVPHIEVPEKPPQQQQQQLQALPRLPSEPSSAQLLLLSLPASPEQPHKGIIPQQTEDPILQAPSCSDPDGVLDEPLGCDGPGGQLFCVAPPSVAATADAPAEEPDGSALGSTGQLGSAALGPVTTADTVAEPSGASAAAAAVFMLPSASASNSQPPSHAGSLDTTLHVRAQVGPMEGILAAPALAVALPEPACEGPSAGAVAEGRIAGADAGADGGGTSALQTDPAAAAAAMVDTAGMSFVAALIQSRAAGSGSGGGSPASETPGAAVALADCGGRGGGGGGGGAGGAAVESLEEAGSRLGRGAGIGPSGEATSAPGAGVTVLAASGSEESGQESSGDEVAVGRRSSNGGAQVTSQRQEWSRRREASAARSSSLLRKVLMSKRADSSTHEPLAHVNVKAPACSADGAAPTSGSSGVVSGIHHRPPPIKAVATAVTGTMQGRRSYSDSRAQMRRAGVAPVVAMTVTTRRGGPYYDRRIAGSARISAMGLHHQQQQFQLDASSQEYACAARQSASPYHHGGKVGAGGDLLGQSAPGAQGALLSAVNSLARSEAANSVVGAGGPGGEPPERRRFVLFKNRESLAFVDSNMTLRSQLFLVLMVTSFVLMPSWATEALSIFSCYQLDDGSGDYPENQRATWTWGYWLRDMNQECYMGHHVAMWVPIGVVSFVLLCLAMPVICARLMYSHRHELREMHVVQVYGFLYRSYKGRFYFWESISQTQTLLLVVVQVFGRTLAVLHQALVLVVLLLLILMFNTYFGPLLHDQLTALQLLSLGTICMTVALGMFTSSGPGAALPTATQALIGALILAINFAIILAFVVFFFRSALPGLRRSTSRLVGRLRQGGTSWRGTLWTVPTLIRRISTLRWRRRSSSRTSDGAQDGGGVDAAGKRGWYGGGVGGERGVGGGGDGCDMEVKGMDEAERAESGLGCSNEGGGGWQKGG